MPRQHPSVSIRALAPARWRKCLRLGLRSIGARAMDGTGRIGGCTTFCRGLLTSAHSCRTMRAPACNHVLTACVRQVLVPSSLPFDTTSGAQGRARLGHPQHPTRLFPSLVRMRHKDQPNRPLSKSRPRNLGISISAQRCSLFPTRV